MAPTPSAQQLASRSQIVLAAVLTILAIAVLSSLADVVVTAMATTAVGVQFGFQVIGVFFAAMPQLGVLLALIAALGILGGQRHATRGAAIAAIVIGLACLISLPLFGLDFLQSRRMVSQNSLKGFTLAGLKTAAFAGLFALLFLWSGWRALQASAKPDQGERGIKGQGLVVGQG